MEQQV